MNIDIIKEIAEAPITSTFLGIAGIIIGIIVTQLSIKRKRPVYNISNINLIQDYNSTIPKLKMLYDGKDIQNLTLTKIAFWNSGRATILGSDMVSKNPLMIEVNEPYEILDCVKAMEEKPENDYTIKPEDKKRVSLSFDYMDKNNGVILYVYHTGDSAMLKGSFKGIRKIRNGKLSDTFIADYVVDAIPMEEIEKKLPLLLRFLFQAVAIITIIPILLIVMVFTLPISLTMRILLFPKRFRFDDDNEKKKKKI